MDEMIRSRRCSVSRYAVQVYQNWSGVPKSQLEDFLKSRLVMCAQHA